MSYPMQLIATLLLILSLALLLASLLFFIRTERAHLNNRIDILHRGNIGGCGVTMVSLYPTSTTPLLAMLDEQLPCSEAMVVCDMQHDISAFGDIVERYHLVRVNHDKFPYIRTLYRSRHRAFRRVVVVDIPLVHRDKSKRAAHDVASFGNILYTWGDTIIEEGVATYAANIIAQNFELRPLVMECVIGGNAILETTGAISESLRHKILSCRALGWSSKVDTRWLAVTAVPLLLIVVAMLCRNQTILAVSALTGASLLLLFCTSCRIVTKRGILATYSMTIAKFYRYTIDKFKIFHYLYKRRCESVVLRPKKRKVHIRKEKEYNNLQL